MSSKAKAYWDDLRFRAQGSEEMVRFHAEDAIAGLLRFPERAKEVKPYLFIFPVHQEIHTAILAGGTADLGARLSRSALEEARVLWRLPVSEGRLGRALQSLEIGCRAYAMNQTTRARYAA